MRSGVLHALRTRSGWRCGIGMGLAGALWWTAVVGLAWLQPALAAPPATSQAAFDDAYAAFHDPHVVLSESAREDLLARMQRAAPARDVARQARLGAAQCQGKALWTQTPQRMRAQVAAAFRLARRARDAEAESRLLACRAAIENFAGFTARALEFAESALAAAQRSGNAVAIADALSARAEYRSTMGDQPAALFDLSESARVLERANIDATPARLELQRATAYRRMGDFTQAQQALRRYQQAIQAHGDWTLQYAYLIEKNYQSLDAGRPDESLQSIAQIMALLQKHGRTEQIDGLRLQRAQAYIALQRYADALADLEKFDASPRLNDDKINAALAALARGQAQAGLHQHDDAVVSYSLAERLLQADDNPRYLSWLYQARADSQQALGDDAAALADYKRYMALSESLQANRSVQQEALRRMQEKLSAGARENAFLLRESRNYQQQRDALLRARRWQTGALILGGLLIALLGYVIREQTAHSRRLRALADHDALTGVASRRNVLAQGQRAVQQARRSQQPLSLLVLDIDHFKAVNDTYGHPFGDVVLAELANACRSVLRSSDIFGRIGGEEFLVLCPNTPPDGALVLAERLRQAVQGMRFAQAPDVRVTTSIGVSAWQRDEASLQAAIARADTALYRAKQNGRNRVEIAQA